MSDDLSRKMQKYASLFATAAENFLGSDEEEDQLSREELRKVRKLLGEHRRNGGSAVSPDPCRGVARKAAVTVTFDDGTEVWWDSVPASLAEKLGDSLGTPDGMKP